MRETVLGVLVALAAVLAVAPIASAGAHQSNTVACCGGTPGFP
ncbi:hypothetical protein [Streptomyces sp. YS415]|nr:hypothetical protein [Streptomyces sp. YS415]